MATRVAAGRYADAPLEVKTTRTTKPSGLVRYRLDALPPAKSKVKASR
ncbi:MAG: hypothetical protein HC933_00435 [Pleurocapsa sp. SU_196_0]|nr:hypothetical protein [Pleurocapsa sp. SU_196_0]